MRLSDGGIRALPHLDIHKLLFAKKIVHNGIEPLFVITRYCFSRRFY